MVGFLGKGDGKMIPHIIHQIWIGSELPEKYRQFTTSMKKMNPDWEYHLWDQEAILSLSDFQNKEAYLKSKSFGVKSDIARYEILNQFGGFYFDTDFECIKPLDSLADKYRLVLCKMDKNSDGVSNGIIGCIPQHFVIQDICNEIKPIKTTEMMDIIDGTGPGLISKIVERNKNNLTSEDIILPTDSFFPIPANSEIFYTDKMKNYYTANTYAVHYWAQSWFDKTFSGWLERKYHRGIKKIKKFLKGKK
ncbi:MAG: hypothetical protein K5930_07725 [Treponemataceae bacterium]|nr:hypothetical protein [Treponemataceae bacterium]